MKDILADAQRALLVRFAISNPLVGLDYDGTLAPIVSDAATASMRRATRRRLDDIATRYPVVILSGRAKADVAEKVSGIAVRAVVGNHGAEPSRGSSKCRKLVARWVTYLHAKLEGLQGVEIEDKAYSIAIHYRSATAQKATQRAIAEAVLALGPEARCFGGKRVENILPKDAPHKGVALLHLKRSLGAETAIYIGDDVTDEDVFALADPQRLLCIRVGRSQKTLAPYYLESQEKIDALFDVLLKT
jgi:trehalose 6-phosphate phosphatase